MKWATFCLFLSPILAQVKSPEPALRLNLVIEGLADPVVVDVPDLTAQIERRGIVGFDMDDPQKQLSAILEAATKGKRDLGQVASLIAACLRVCEKCRARALTPMTEEDLKSLYQWRFDPHAIFQEARVRGVKGLEVSEAQATELRAIGASDELIQLLVPDDRIPTIPLANYPNQFKLMRADGYDPAATEGRLSVTTELPANSESEFVFKHNALFWSAKGGDPSDLGAYFSKPAPRNTESVKYEVVCRPDDGGNVTGSNATPAEKKRGIIPFKPKGKASPPPPPSEFKAHYSSAGEDGRNSFSIILTNNESNSRRYTFVLRWSVVSTPNPLTSTPKGTCTG